jgi:hypothetical protein
MRAASARNTSPAESIGERPSSQIARDGPWHAFCYSAATIEAVSASRRVLLLIEDELLDETLTDAAIEKPARPSAPLSAITAARPAQCPS